MSFTHHTPCQQCGHTSHVVGVFHTDKGHFFVCEECLRGALSQIEQRKREIQGDEGPEITSTEDEDGDDDDEGYGILNGLAADMIAGQKLLDVIESGDFTALIREQEAQREHDELVSRVMLKLVMDGMERRKKEAKEC